LPGHVRDLRERSGGYTGKLPIQARWRSPVDARERQEKSFATKREARIWMSQQDADANAGTRIDPRFSRDSFGAVAEAWLEAKRIESGPKTVMGYESILNAHILPRFGKRRIIGIDAEDVQKFVGKLVDSGKRPHTVHSIYTVLRMVMKFAVERKRIPVSPCSGVKLPKARTGEPTALTHAQVRQLVDAMPDLMTRVAVLTSAYMGLRAGELWGLQRDDIALVGSKGTLRIDESLKEVTTKQVLPAGYRRVTSTLILGPPKTPAAERKLPIPSPLVPELQKLMAAGSDEFVFTIDGQAIHHNAFYKKVFLKNTPAALLGTRWHDLRHTCASLLIESAKQSGLHDRMIIAWEIAKYLGHENVTTTLQIYSHMLPGAHEALAEGLAAGWLEAAESSAGVVPIR
jgi:integrase